MKRIAAFIGVSLLALALGGCGLGGHPLAIEPVGQKGGEIQPSFKQAYYRVDRDHTVYFYLKAAKAKGATIDQTVIIRVFWKPIGGTTSLNASAINSTFRYVVMNSAGAGMYEGAGFVRFYGRIGGKNLRARIIDGDLRLTEATSGYTDTLKRSRFRGTFTARLDDTRTLDLILQSQRDFFARTYAAIKGNAPATTEPTATAPAITQ